MLKVVTSPDPILRQTCKDCTVGDKSLVRVSKQMARLMYSNNGCGIAAPQVGLDARLVVIDVDWDGENASTRNPIVLVNPVIEELKGEPVESLEGCLSCPGINVPVERKPWARVSYFDLDGEEWEIEGDGLLGRCLQHEIDHLNGITLFESCAPRVKAQVLAAYEEALKNGAKPGDTLIEVK
jgi:peptide deformylase